MINLHEYEKMVLEVLKAKKEAGIEELIENTKLNKDAIIWALQMLEQQGLISIERQKIFVIKLKEEARQYVNEFPEEKLINDINKNQNKININKLDKIGIIWAKKNLWIIITQGLAGITKKGLDAINSDYKQRTILNMVNKKNEQDSDFFETNKGIIEILKNRNLIEVKDKSIITKVSINKINNIALGNENEVNVLTKEFIKKYNNENIKFKNYDINANVDPVYPARRHPLSLFINKIRKIWIELGFKEVSGPIIDSSFWVFDALFSPQDHPTRDVQDTFFLSNPKELDISDKKLINKIKNMHQKNWREKWYEAIAKQAILRTHSTNVSAHYLHNISSTDKPIKLFTIGKIFRNESIDFKHLAEFHQVDGLIIGENLNFSNLIFELKRFYEKLNPKIKINIKPSYFPFVEPGMELNYLDKKTNSVIELGGSGIIREEICKAMNLKKKNVLAFGLGIERLIFDILPLSSLTELYKNDIGMLRNIKEIK